jgi:hypothetical protein
MTETISVPMQTPLVGLKMDADTALYVGLLEGTIAHLVINEMKYRALLELFTGEPFEATKIGIDGRTLIDLAISTLVKQTGMDLSKAKLLVLQRWNQFNQATPVIPQAVEPAKLVESLGATTEEPTEGNRAVRQASQRFRDWVASQQASAAKLSDEDATKDDVTQ